MPGGPQYCTLWQTHEMSAPGRSRNLPTNLVPLAKYKYRRGTRFVGKRVRATGEAFQRPFFPTNFCGCPNSLFSLQDTPRFFRQLSDNPFSWGKCTHIEYTQRGSRTNGSDTAWQPRNALQNSTDTAWSFRHVPQKESDSACTSKVRRKAGHRLAAEKGVAKRV